MIKMGTMVGDRYEILELVGNGGMADVYKAKCHKLNRFVAVKVLKQEFSENKEFVSKFRTEAQAAAGLAHPNIVNVYDVGEEDGIYYIVMELVEGITLKRYIEKKARLSVKEAVSIAIQISMGIEAAHNNGIIHRDIKPQNIIISKEGKVKVTDFGIAKAATSNTITSNVMGSVHYTSPEQARGGFSDAKSDIYSLGISMFEMLTGRVPFNGDTTVTIAIKHIQEEMPSPRNYVPEIPISVEQIVLKCTQKSPDRRYQNMAELIEDLKKSLISPDENFVKLDTMDKNGATQVVPQRERQTVAHAAGSAAENGGIAPNTGYIPPVRNQQSQRNVNPMAPRTEQRAVDRDRSQGGMQAKDGQPRKKAAASGSERKNPDRKNSDRSNIERKNISRQPQPEPRKRNVRNEELAENRRRQAENNSNRNRRRIEEYDDDDEDDSLIEKLKTVVIIAIAVVIGCIVLYFAGLAMGIFGNGSIFSTGDESQMVTVPNIEGMLLNEATRELKKANVTYKVEYKEAKDVVANHVIQTEPAAKSKINSETEVIVYVSMEGNGVSVPDVTTLSEAEATSKLEEEGFVVAKVQDFDEEIPKGNVVKQSPEGDSFLERGGSVTITISMGSSKAEYTMPDLRGNTEEAARETLKLMGLECTSVSECYDDEVAPGLVCYQSYTVGSSIKEGQGVDLRLSLGPEPRYYDCNIVVSAPPNYAGGDANVVLKTSNNEELFNTNTSSFPVNINLSQIYGIPKGTVSVSYTIMSQQENFDAEGNSLGIQEVPSQDVYSYDVEFDS